MHQVGGWQQMPQASGVGHQAPEKTGIRHQASGVKQKKRAAVKKDQTLLINRFISDA
jgi:hypothetical protein